MLTPASFLSQNMYNSMGGELEGGAYCVQGTMLSALMLSLARSPNNPITLARGHQL